MSERIGKETALYRNRVGLSPRIGDLERPLSAPGFEGCVKAMFLGEPPMLELIKLRLEEQFGGGIYLARSYVSFLEVMAAGASKGAGLELVMENRGLKGEEVIAMGDEENDIPMFRVCHSIATANAKEEVRAAAELTVGSNAEDGAAVFLSDFFGFGASP
jgi:hydroxymethylpyrimidine pyrophosphatase-like HAD family hydrolase